MAIIGIPAGQILGGPGYSAPNTREGILQAAQNAAQQRAASTPATRADTSGGFIANAIRNYTGNQPRASAPRSTRQSYRK